MRILCFGDSNTYGYNPRSFFGDRYAPENRWVDLLAAQTDWEIINAGENGRKIPRNLCRFAQSADILLVMLGTNDLLQGTSAREAATRMETFLTQLLPHCPNLLLVCPPPVKRGAWVSSDSLVTESIQLGEEYELLARRLGISFVDTRDWNIDLSFDGVHFTEAGHRAFAAQLIKYLHSLLTLPLRHSL